MSIDLDIFATAPELATWSQIRSKLQMLVSPTEQTTLLGNSPSLCEIGSNKEVVDNKPLSIGHYYLSLPTDNTLGIGVISKTEDFEEESLELDYLEDYGRNLELEEIEILAKRWRKADYYYGIETWGGRSKPEPRLFVALAAAIAYSCNGYVVVMNENIFDLGIGVYRPEQFQYAEPRF